MSVGGRGLLSALVMALATEVASAETEPSAPAPAFNAESSYTLVAQDGDHSPLDAALTGSLDLFLTVAGPRDRLEAYFEGNLDLATFGVATGLPEINGDAGSAVESDLSGRFQLSELRYTRSWRDERRWLAVGLLDATAVLDTAAAANDETTQFLGAPFVNNPTIEFPDYAVGAAAAWTTRKGLPDWALVVTSSNGLADNPGRSYRELVRLDDRHKGLFVGTEATWSFGRHAARLGVWAHGADHETLDQARTKASNGGLYAVLDAGHGAWTMTLRLGAADPDVTAAHRFVAVAAQRAWNERLVGLAAAYTSIADDAGPVGSTSHFEAYARFPLTERLSVTPSLQYVDHPGASAGGPPVAGEVLVWSVRLRHVFLTLDRPR